MCASPVHSASHLRRASDPDSRPLDEEGVSLLQGGCMFHHASHEPDQNGKHTYLSTDIIHTYTNTYYYSLSVRLAAQIVTTIHLH